MADECLQPSQFINIVGQDDQQGSSLAVPGRLFDMYRTFRWERLSDSRPYTVANEKCDSHVCLLSSNFILAYKLNFR
jgi:hypothetical protein